MRGLYIFYRTGLKIQPCQRRRGFKKEAEQENL